MPANMQSIADAHKEQEGDEASEEALVVAAN